MPTGPEHIGYSCTEALRFYEFESPTSSAVAGWVAANAGCGRKSDGVLFSKNSVTFGYDDGSPGVSKDFFGGCIDPSCNGSRVSECFQGEPSTPNGAGDCVLAHSPMGSLATAIGHTCEQPSMGLRAENVSDVNNLERRSCSFLNDDALTYPLSGHPAPMSALRHSRYLSAVSCDESGFSCALRATTVVGASGTYLDCNAARLKQQLREQFIENQRLRHLMLLRDEQLSVLRAEVIHLQAQMAKVHTSHRKEVKEHKAEVPPKLLFDLQRAHERLIQQELQLSGGSCGKDSGRPSPAASLCAQPRTSDLSATNTSSSVTVSEESDLSIPKPLSSHSILRVDTPPHEHEARSCASRSSSLLQEGNSVSAFELFVAPTEHLQKQVAREAADTTGESLQRGSSFDASMLAAAPLGVDALSSSLVTNAVTVTAAAGSLELHPILAVERTRTNRAHAALLFSSRQAAWLAARLAQTQAHLTAVYQEMRDWRRACLDNHKELAKHRRAATAAVVVPAK